MEQTTQTQELLHQCSQYSNFFQKAFCEGGVVMYFIAFVFILTVLLVVERFFKLKKFQVNKKDLNEKLYSFVLRGNLREAVAFCDSHSAPLTNTLKAGLVQVLNKRPDEEVQVAMDAVVLKETPEIEGWASFLAVFGNIGVLVGLLGTVAGLITSFAGVAEADAATKAILLSRGIAEALNCTAFGLFVAIIAIIFYGYFQIQISRIINSMAEGSMNLMNLIVSNRDKLKYD